jgi:hypothetical protein
VSGVFGHTGSPRLYIGRILSSLSPVDQGTQHRNSHITEHCKYAAENHPQFDQKSHRKKYLRFYQPI